MPRTALSFITIGFSFSAAAIWAMNSSVFLTPRSTDSLILAHRGVHQNFDRTGVDNQSCTAELMEAPTHQYLENTLGSIGAAFGFGADIVEIDVHPTTDGNFAVFHDWTLGCRTDGTGRVRDHSAEYLKQLDIGYGYTADGGKTYPFRGRFIGKMPMLNEVFDNFPNGKFLINIKSHSAEEGEKLAAYLETQNISAQDVFIYGDQTPIEAVKRLNPNIVTMGKQQSKTCLKTYAALGWSNYLPKSCRNTWVPVPENYTPLIWGWPSRFEKRLSKVGSTAVLMGPHSEARSDPAIDSLNQVSQISDDFRGVIWTNKIEIIGPALEACSEDC